MQVVAPNHRLSTFRGQVLASVLPLVESVLAQNVFQHTTVVLRYGGLALQLVLYLYSSAPQYNSQCRSSHAPSIAGSRFTPWERAHR